MSKLKVLSGPKIIRVIEGFGFVVSNKKGSHVKMRRVAGNGSRQTLTIPSHKK